LAAEYLELAGSKLQVAKDRVVLDWQKNFQSGQFKEAAAAYRQMGSVTSLDNSGDVRTLDMMRAEYRKALDPLVESWNEACANGDFTRTDEIRDQISELLPEPSFVADLRTKMSPCTPPAPPETTPVARLGTARAPEAAARADRATGTTPQGRRGCFKMDAPLAIVRLKERVEPNFSSQALAFLQNSSTTVRVKVRIDDSGNVTVIEASGPNVLLTNPVRTAVAAWKFTPALDEQGPRCVETEFPIVISRR
jgi:hypothetical protein